MKHSTFEVFDIEDQRRLPSSYSYVSLFESYEYLNYNMFNCSNRTITSTLNVSFVTDFGFDIDFKIKFAFIFVFNFD